MPEYKMSDTRNDKWRAWFTLNGIPTEQIVRNSVVTVNILDAGDTTADVVQFVTESGQRVLHHCTCEYGGGHIAKKTTRYPITETLGSWAEADRLVEA